MNEHEILLPDGWPRPSGYSHGVAATGRIISIAGQVGWNPLTEDFETSDFVEQVRIALRNMNRVLAKAGATAADVVRMNWYITERDTYLHSSKRLGTVYREECGHHYPAMTVVVVASLIDARAKVEIEATAVIPA